MSVFTWTALIVLLGALWWALYQLWRRQLRLDHLQTVLKETLRRTEDFESHSHKKELHHLQSEERLRSYLQLLDTLINTIPNPIYFKTLEGVFLGCNRVFAREILGLTRDNIIGRRAQDLPQQIPPDLAALCQRQEGIMYEKGTFHSFESEVLCTDGRRHEFLFSLAPVKGREGEVTGCVAVLADLTEKNRAAQDRLKSVKLQGVLETAGAVCHEFNQPLQALSGYTEIMAAKMGADDGGRPYLEKIGAQIERMREITDKLQGITRYETMEYADKTKIIDIHKASAGVESKDS
jgi:PAS domain S-box-containing protein